MLKKGFTVYTATVVHIFEPGVDASKEQSSFQTTLSLQTLILLARGAPPIYDRIS
jgi:hypothetical protein